MLKLTTKEQEFSERFGMVLKRFDIRDRFNQFDSNIAKLTIIRQAYQILYDMAKEATDNESSESNGPIDSVKQPDEPMGEDASRWENEGGSGSTPTELQSNSETGTTT